jgi:Ca2+-binding EF-hand superfamily protein
MLKFFDDTQVSVIGLDDIMAELHAGGREATDETAKEIIKRLEAKNNYIPSTERIRREYAYILLKEYRAYIKDRSVPGL